MPNDAASERMDVPLLPLKNVVVFPRTIVNLTIGRARSLNAVNQAAEGDHRLVVVAVKDGEQDDPTPEDLYTIGTIVEVKSVRRQPDNTLQVEVEALRRVKIEVDHTGRRCSNGPGGLPAGESGGRARDYRSDERAVRDVR